MHLIPSEQLRDALLLRYNHSSGFHAFSSIGAMRIFLTYWYVPYAYAEVGVRGLWEHLNPSLNSTYHHHVSKGADYSHIRNNFTANANAQYYSVAVSTIARKPSKPWLRQRHCRS
ncbi:MAG: hypothetical protein SPM02_04185 [Bacteroidales bacterium]|nr:hypothetical protein [Bacteroidales bacterium]